MLVHFVPLHLFTALLLDAIQKSISALSQGVIQYILSFSYFLHWFLFALYLHTRK